MHNCGGLTLLIRPSIVHYVQYHSVYSTQRTRGATDVRHASHLAKQTLHPTTLRYPAYLYRLHTSPWLSRFRSQHHIPVAPKATPFHPTALRAPSANLN